MKITCFKAYDIRGKLLEQLDEREREIFTARQLQDDHKAPTLEILSQQFGISRERVRQLEKRAFDKIKKFIHEAA